MNVNSVTSNVSAYTRAATQTSQAQQTQQTQQAQQSQQTQQIERREARPEERVDVKDEAPKPVTNALGQKTGSVISVTA